MRIKIRPLRRRREVIIDARSRASSIPCGRARRQVEPFCLACSTTWQEMLRDVQPRARIIAAVSMTAGGDDAEGHRSPSSGRTPRGAGSS